MERPKPQPGHQSNPIRAIGQIVKCELASGSKKESDTSAMNHNAASRGIFVLKFERKILLLFIKK